jgi:hypothetical protein
VTSELLYSVKTIRRLITTLCSVGETLYRSNNKNSKLQRDKYYKSGRKAVASHSLHGEFNPYALSKYLPNERSMDPEDRKNSLLPCGYTLAQSWDALRKCWKGFYISRSQNNSDGMSEYASRIRKLQLEMGIQVTKFDDDILGELHLNQIQQDTDEDEIQHKNVRVAPKMINSCRYVPLKERAPDYDDVMDKSSQIIGTKDLARPSPREDIFYKPRIRSSKSCQHITSKMDTHRAGSKNTSWTRHDGNTITYVNPGNIYNQPHSDDPRSTLEEEDNACCSRSPVNESESEDKEKEEQGNRRSCHYKEKRSYY